jgi:hypothetical protein
LEFTVTATDLIADAKRKGVDLSLEDAERYVKALDEWAKPWAEPVDVGTANDVIELKSRLGIQTFKDFTRLTK